MRKVVRYTYSEELARAAETFLIDQFNSPTQFVEASHLTDLVDAAMHIVTGAAWIQGDVQRRYPLDAALDEQDGDDEEDEEDEP